MEASGFLNGAQPAAQRFASGAVRGCSAAGLCMTMTVFATPAGAQSSGAEAVPLPGSAVVLSVVRWNGSLSQLVGRTVELTFSLFADQAGGLALWHETQTVKIDRDGRYSVLLGATSADGLSQSLFQAGEARWIEARVLPTERGDAGTAAAPDARSLLLCSRSIRLQVGGLGDFWRARGGGLCDAGRPARQVAGNRGDRSDCKILRRVRQLLEPGPPAMCRCGQGARRWVTR